MFRSICERVFLKGLNETEVFYLGKTGLLAHKSNDCKTAINQ